MFFPLTCYAQVAIGAELTGGWAAAALYGLTAVDKLFAPKNSTADQIQQQLTELQQQVSAIAVQLNDVAAEVTDLLLIVSSLTAFHQGSRGSQGPPGPPGFTGFMGFTTQVPTGAPGSHHSLGPARQSPKDCAACPLPGASWCVPDGDAWSRWRGACISCH
jgi:hypothetical protein